MEIDNRISEMRRRKNYAKKIAEILEDYYGGKTTEANTRKRLVKEKVITREDAIPSDEMIGEIVVKPEDGMISMGYTFHYNYHRRGYAYEVLTALIDLLHERLLSYACIVFTEPENEPSMALLKILNLKRLLSTGNC